MLHIYKYHLVPTNGPFWWLGIRKAVLEMQKVVCGGIELKLNSVANRELVYIWLCMEHPGNWSTSQSTPQSSKRREVWFYPILKMIPMASMLLKIFNP